MTSDKSQSDEAGEQMGVLGADLVFRKPVPRFGSCDIVAPQSIAATPNCRRGVPAGRRARVPKSTCRTIAGDFCDMRTRSSIAIGVGPSRAMMRLRSSSAGLAVVWRHLLRGALLESEIAARIGSSAAMTSRLGYRRGALLEQAVGAFRARIERRAGTANTSRPCSPASRAVMSEPERRAASTMTTPSASPEISRLRRGKSRVRGSQLSGISEIAAPSARDTIEQVAHARPDRCRSWPPASTAIVPVARLARCAAASMPRARPETMP